MYTLNEILTLIENEATAHLQVQQYGHGDVWEINPKELDYLVLWAIEESVVLSERTLTYNIRLLAMDRVLPGEENEQEVMSDTIQVLLDFVAYFRQLHTTDLSIQTSVSFEPFTERFDDKVSGHACVLSITQPYDYNKCQIPQTTNTIPPTVDGITLYDFCNQATIDRLTATQLACLQSEFGGSCDPVTEQINGVTIGTTPSGDTNNQVITDSAANPVGTEANPSVIGDATVTINSASLGATGSILAEGSQDLVVNLDGSPAGSWDGDSWEVTSAVCADATVNINGVFMENIPSGDTENIQVRQETGATLVGSKQGQHWRIDNSQAQVNGVNTETIPATVTHNQLIQDSAGADVGTAANPSVIADTSVTVNGDAFDTVVAEGSIDVPVEYVNGTPVGTINAGVVQIPNPVTCGSVVVTVSDDTPTIGDVITITATPSGITPDTYKFYYCQGDDLTEIAEQAGNTYDWTISVIGTYTITVIATEGSDPSVIGYKSITAGAETDAEAWLTAVGIPSDSTVYFSGTPYEITGNAYWVAVSLLVIALKAAGSWSKLHWLYLYAGGSASIGKINLVNPADTDAAFRITLYGGWVFGSTGRVSNATNTYGDTHFNANTHLAANDGCYFTYKRTQPTGTTTTSEFGAINTGTGAGSFFISKATTDRSFYSIGASKQVNGLATSTLDGFQCINRENNASLQKWYGNDGTVTDSDTTAFVGHASLEDYVGARNTNGAAGLYLENGSIISCEGRADGLTATEVEDTRVAIDTLMTALNWNV